MRSIILIGLGFLFWAVCLLTGRVLMKEKSVRRRRSTYTFIFLWLLLAASNMYIGVSRAGYSIFEELPIFLMVFLIPALPAFIIHRKLS